MKKLIFLIMMIASCTLGYSQSTISVLGNSQTFDNVNESGNDLLPTGGNVSLGSAANPFKDLFVSGNSINVGGVIIGSDGVFLEIGGDTIMTNTQFNTYLAQVGGLTKSDTAIGGIIDQVYATDAALAAVSAGASDGVINGVTVDALNQQVDFSTTAAGSPVNDVDFSAFTFDSELLDNDASNEFQDLNLSGQDLTLSNSAVTIDLSGFLDNTDSQTAAQVPVTLSPTNYTVSAATTEGHFTGLNDKLGVVDDSLAVHTDSITNLHLRIIDLEVADIADTDQSSTNEIQDLSLSGTELILTSDGTNTDLSSFTTDAEAAATYEPIITKNTGFNLDLGTTSGTVAEGNHTHTASQVTDFDTEVSNNASVVANTAKVSADGSVTSHSDVTDAGSGIIISAAERTAISSNTANLTQDDLSNNTTSDLAEGTNLYYTEARVSANTDVAANTANRHVPVTLGTIENNLVTLTGQQLDVVTPTLAQTLGKGASAGNVRISDVGTPLLTSDATTKAYVDAQDLAGETEVLDSISNHNDRISDLEDIDHVAATISATNNNQGRFTITGQEFGLTTNTLQEIYSAGTLLTQNNTLSSGAFNWTISANNSNFLSVTPSSVSMSSINAGNGASITTSNTGGILLDFENEGLSIDNNYGTDGQIIISKGNNANPEYINRTEKYTAVTGITTTIGTVTQIQQKEIEDNGTVTGYVKFIYDNQGNNGETTIKIPNLTSQDFTTQNDVMYSGLAAVTSIFTAVAPFINGYERTLDLTNDQIEITFDPTGTTPQYLFEFSYTYEK